MKNQKPKSTGDPKTDALRVEVRRRLAEEDAARQFRLMGFTTPADLQPYVPDERNPDVLVRGRWLERGGSAWIVSTSGTGKSIHAMQLMLSFALGKPFSGLVPNNPLRFWYVQSEDSPTRLAIDRDDTTAELAETWQDVQPEAWREAWKRVTFAPIKGCGAEFVNDLAMKLETARNLAVLPDVLVINPFLAIVGGPVVDGSFVTPFLRGGRVANQPTEGLQHILEHFKVGALIYHHTPKPPTDKEIGSWLKSNFPEYQGAGSSDITNWGRSFITMMRVPGKHSVVCLTAGKNGADLGWDNIDGGYRNYMAWSKSNGVTGKTRHAWRELTAAEFAEVSHMSNDHLLEDINAIVAKLMENPQRYSDLAKTNAGLSRGRFRAAWAVVKVKYPSYGLAAYQFIVGNYAHVIYGKPEMAKKQAETFAKNWANANNSHLIPEVKEYLLPIGADRCGGSRVPGAVVYNTTTAPIGTQEAPHGGTQYEQPEILTEELQI